MIPKWNFRTSNLFYVERNNWISLLAVTLWLSAWRLEAWGSEGRNPPLWKTRIPEFFDGLQCGSFFELLFGWSVHPSNSKVMSQHAFPRMLLASGGLNNFHKALNL